MGVLKMKKTRNNKGEIWLFRIVISILIIGHCGLVILAYNSKQIFYSIIPFLFLGIQTYRIYNNGIEYNGWVNSEIKPTTTAYILIGAPIPYFSYSLANETAIWYWISTILLVFFIIYFIYLLIKINSVRDSFYNTSVSIRDILNIFNNKELNYKKVEEDINILDNKLNRVLSIPNYNCKIIKMRNKVVVKPNDRKSINKVYEIIDLIQKEIVND